MIRCTKCRRKLTREPTFIAGSAFGPTCARSITGIKARRSRKVKADSMTADLFAEAQA